MFHFKQKSRSVKSKIGDKRVDGAMVSIAAFQTVDLDSIPGQRNVYVVSFLFSIILKDFIFYF